MKRPTARDRKQPVSLTLNTAIVRDARALTDNLAGVVERLLTEFVSDARASHTREAERLAAAASLWSEFTERHGSLSDDYSTL